MSESQPVGFYDNCTVFAFERQNRLQMLPLCRGTRPMRYWLFLSQQVEKLVMWRKVTWKIWRWWPKRPMSSLTGYRLERCPPILSSLAVWRPCQSPFLFCDFTCLTWQLSCYWTSLRVWTCCLQEINPMDQCMGKRTTTLPGAPGILPMQPALLKDHSMKCQFCHEIFSPTSAVLMHVPHWSQ